MVDDNPFQYWRLCAWTGPVLLVVTLIFWGVLGHNIPPYSADLTADAFAAQFSAHALEIRLGMIVTITFSVFYFTWGVAITKVMEKVERNNNILSICQLFGAALTTMIFVIPCAIWIGATFRADTLPPQTLQIIFDIGWILFDLAYSLTTLQMVAIGVCFLQDRRAIPLFPKWLCWFSIWVGLMFIIEAVNPFFKGGPFSRSGVLNYWVEFGIFFAFMLLISIWLLKAITRLEAEHRAGI